MNDEVPQNDRKVYAGLEFWEREAFLEGNMIRFAPEKEAEMRAGLEKDVLEWLKDDKADSTLEFRFWGANDKPIYLPIVLFHRAEIYIKNCANGWAVWRIATCSSYDRMISYKVKEIGINDIRAIEDGFKMPNEVRSQETGIRPTDPEYRPDMGIWGLV